jgi:transcriptional enhancer factor
MNVSAGPSSGRSGSEEKGHEALRAEGLPYMGAGEEQEPSGARGSPLGRGEARQRRRSQSTPPGEMALHWEEMCSKCLKGGVCGRRWANHCCTMASPIPYTLPADDRTRDAVQTIVSGRKSWKTLKGKGEAVWPPYLEAALVEGMLSRLSAAFVALMGPLALHKYRPETSRSARSLSRFPNRNRFISDYIFHVTGKRRTAKQVGSRLQQLRDTCGGKRILKLLSSRDFSAPDDDVPLGPAPPAGFKPSRALVTIDVLPADAPWPQPNASSSSGLRPAAAASAILTPPLSPASPISALPALATALAPCPAPASPGVAHSAVTTFRSPFPRPLRAIDPTVTFISAALVHASSSCAVYFNGNCVHRETTKMDISPAQDTHGYVYRVGLVPNFWHKLCDSPG